MGGRGRAARARRSRSTSFCGVPSLVSLAPPAPSPNSLSSQQWYLLLPHAGTRSERADPVCVLQADINAIAKQVSSHSATNPRAKPQAHSASFPFLFFCSSPSTTMPPLTATAPTSLPSTSVLLLLQSPPRRFADPHPFLQRPQSMLTFEGEPIQGADAVIAKLVVRPQRPRPAPPLRTLTLRFSPPPRRASPSRPSNTA